MACLSAVHLSAWPQSLHRPSMRPCESRPARRLATATEAAPANLTNSFFGLFRSANRAPHSSSVSAACAEKQASQRTGGGSRETRDEREAGGGAAALALWPRPRRLWAHSAIPDCPAAPALLPPLQLPDLHPSCRSTPKCSSPRPECTVTAGSPRRRSPRESGSGRSDRTVRTERTEQSHTHTARRTTQQARQADIIHITTLATRASKADDAGGRRALNARFLCLCRCAACLFVVA